MASASFIYCGYGCTVGLGMFFDRCKLVFFGGRGVRGSWLNPPCLGLSRGKTDLVVVAVQGAPPRLQYRESQS